MNLLEINATKLIEILHTDSELGLKSENVQKNREEFVTDNKKKPNSFMLVFKDIFGDIIPILFVVLSLISFEFDMGGGAMLSLVLMGVVYLSFRLLARHYSRSVTKVINAESTRVTVIRNGDKQSIDYTELVPGDIMLLQFGDVVPCDALVIQQNALKVSEIQLTGKSVPILKLTQEETIKVKGIPYYECIIFAGSVVMSGTAKVLVCNVGKDVFDKKNKLTTRSGHARKTRIFEIAEFISRQLSLVWILISFILFIWGALRGQDIYNVLYLSVTLAVASTPDLVLTLFDLTLLTGSKRLLKNGCIIRDMSALDRMCDISCVIADNSRYFRTSSPKPNTVYVNDENKKFRGAGEKDVRELFEYAVVACVSSGGGLKYNGISTEQALIDYAGEIGLSQSKLYEKYLLLEKRPYTEETGISRAIVFREHEFFVISVGTPSAVLKTCSYIENKGRTETLDDRQKRNIRELSRVIASGNEGVVAIAVKKIEYREGSGQIDNNRGHSFKGYIGLHTSIKADSARAVNICQKAGMDIVLMTNEGLSTSKGFARSLSIVQDGDKIIEAKELEGIDTGLFRVDIKNYKVYVSLDSDKKAEIARWRKDDGDIIAVTASNIDDLRLLIESDVSFCPGDVTNKAVRQNSDVIMNGGFELVPECMKYARSVYRNTRHMLQYFLSFQFILLFATLLSMMFLGRAVFTSGTIMTYSVLISLPIALALATQELRGNELRDTFGVQNVGINFQNILLIPCICALVAGAVITLCAKISYLSSSWNTNACANAFIALSSSSVFTAWSISADDSFDISMFKNKQLIFASLLSFGFMALFVYSKSLSSLIGAVAPSFESFMFSVALGFVPALFWVGINVIKKYVLVKKIFK